MENKIQKMVHASLFLALAYLLPFLTGQIPTIGAMLCPMHLPVLICGFLCGPLYGFAIGIIVPIFRSLTLGAPPLFPTAVCMTFELGTYGAVAGIMHKILPKRKSFTYVSLISAMFVGRIVWGVASFIAYGCTGQTFTLAAFFTAAIVNALPGILLQIIAVPILVNLIENSARFKQGKII